MKWIGQYIQGLISRFRNDVYLEATETGTIASGSNLGLDSNNKIVKSASPSGTIDLTSEVTGTLPVGSGGTGATTLADNSVLTGTGTSAISAESNLTFDGSTLTATCPSVVFEHSVSGQLTVKNTGNNTTPGTIKLENTRNGTAGQGGDSTGSIVFFGNNNAGSPASHKFAEILAKSADVAADQEAGELLLKVAEFDGTVTTGLKLDGDTDANGEIDVTIGAGAASLTTIAGTLTMGSTAFVNNSGVVQVATQGTIDHDSLANFVANEHIDWTGDVSASSVIHTENITDLHGAGVDGAAGSVLTDAGNGKITDNASFTWDGDDMLISSATSQKPIVEIRNTNTDGHGPELKLNNTKGGSTDGADNDFAGKVTFHAMDDGTPSTQQYGEVNVRVHDATSTEESGTMNLYVATHNGNLGLGLQLQGGSTTNEVDATIGNGTASLTTVAGDLAVTTEATIPSRKFTATGATHFEYQGDVLYFGGGSTTQGDLCYLKENGEWGQADADGAATGDDADRDAMGMLAIALGTDPDVDGMFIRGTITMDYDMGDVGNPIYVKTVAGAMSHEPPTTSGDFVRVVGYCLDDADGQMYFNPDNTWVEIA